MTFPETNGNQAPAAPGRPRVLLVDDHDAGRKAIARLLRAMGFDVVDAGDGASALQILGEEGPRFDYVLTDLRLPDLDGREIVHAARLLTPAPRIALMTGWDVDAGEKERLGIEWIFLKPLDVGDIVAKLQRPPTAPSGPAAG